MLPRARPSTCAIPSAAAKFDWPILRPFTVDMWDDTIGNDIEGNKFVGLHMDHPRSDVYLILDETQGSSGGLSESCRWHTCLY